MAGLHLRLCMVVGLCVGAVSGGISCKSEDGRDVDFAYSFKFPKSWDYAYMDSSHELKKSSHEMNSASSAVSATLAQLQSHGVSYMLWNDQPPPSKDSSAPYAHAKGALIFDKEQGVWLTHSLPHFPSQKGDLWKDGADDFGQTFLCITISTDEVHKLAGAFAITRPVVYESSLLDEKEFSDMAKVINKDWDEDTMTTEVDITSKGGQSFTYFAKAGRWGEGKDLYHDLVGKKLGDLQMEGWRRGAGVWGPACSKPRVFDITSVNFPGAGWSTTNDHSKWAVSRSSSEPYFCVGDINRAKGQDKRGGGTVCIRDASFHSQVAKVVDETDACSTVTSWLYA